MCNPFKTTHKIIKISNPEGHKEYFVRYGNLFSSSYLLKSGKTCKFYDTAETCGGNFESLAAAEEAILSHKKTIA